MSQQTENIMKKISLEKVVLNMGVGKSGEPLETGKKGLEQIIDKKPNLRNANKAYRDWGVRKGEPIGVAVTVRGKSATELLKRLLTSKGNKISSRSFDKSGNFSFSIKEHIDIEGVKYDPKIGILGLDIAVRLTRPGFNIRVRGRHKSTVGKHHKITPDEAKNFVTKEFGVSVS